MNNINNFLNDLMEEFTTRGYIDKVVDNKDVFSEIASDKLDLKVFRFFIRCLNITESILMIIKG